MRQKSITDFVVYELLKISIKTVMNLFDDEECLPRMCDKIDYCLTSTLAQSMYCRRCISLD